MRDNRSSRRSGQGYTKSSHSRSQKPPRSSNESKPEDATRELGQTSDEYGPEAGNPITEMPPGDQIAMTNPDVQQIGPPGGAAYERGFGDQTWRRDR